MVSNLNLFQFFFDSLNVIALLVLTKQAIETNTFIPEQIDILLVHCT